MWWIFLLMGPDLAIANITSEDPVRDQLIIFKDTHMGPLETMTTSFGAPVNSIDARTTVNRRILYNENFMDSITHLVRERIPERVVHAKGVGAFGYFEVTDNITNICKAKLFSHVGKRTPVAVRFSSVASERGGSDTTREPRGFAVKFYTEEGNLDITCLNTPVFGMKDPIVFPQLTRAQKRNPATNVHDSNMLWDFITMNPESLFFFLKVQSDSGIPNGYRHMPGHALHTFQLVNDEGEIFFVRFHILPEAGIESLTSEEAMKITGEDLDYATRDLYRAIGKGEYPGWKFCIQVLTVKDVETAKFDVFDLTKVLPEVKYPLRTVGRIVLNKNPTNFHADVELMAFAPSNLVPGILGAPDKVFEARLIAYREAQQYRLGGNYNRIPVNCPLKSAINNYNRDGVPPVGDNGGAGPNYYPNAFNGPVEYVEKNRVDVIDIYTDPNPNNFDQMTELYENGFTKEVRNELIENLLVSLKKAAKFLQVRTVELFERVHPDLAHNIEVGLALNVTKCY